MLKIYSFQIISLLPRYIFSMLSQSFFFCHPSILRFVIPVRDTGIYLILIMEVILTYVPRICVSVTIWCHPSASTLGSRYKNIYKLCNGQQILVAYNVHGENKIDPSVTHWDDKEMAIWMTGKKSTGMTPAGRRMQRSYSYVSCTGMTPMIYFKV